MRDPTADTEPRYRIERAPQGYRVVGPGLLIWEPTLGEAAQRREELEGWPPRWRAHAMPLRDAPFDDGPVYGPVASRRLGLSLGVDCSPRGRRACNFACVYCTRNASLPRGHDEGWPTPRAIADALAAALRRAPALDSVTISGHGEPTLHPCFADVVDAVLETARGAHCGAPVRILTNGSEVAREPVRRALDRLDERIVKLDADGARIDRPCTWRAFALRPLAFAALRDVTLQACFVGGAFTNAASDSVCAWCDLVAAVAPRAVQIYTIDRQPAVSEVLPLPAAQLEEIACSLRARTGIEAGVFATNQFRP